MIRRVARGKRQGEGGEQAGSGCTCVVCCGCGGRTSIPCGCTCACLRTSYPAHRPREICHQANPSKQPSNSQQVVTIWNGLRRQIAQAAGSQPLTCRSDRSSPGRLSCVDHLVEMEPLLWREGDQVDKNHNTWRILGLGFQVTVILGPLEILGLLDILGSQEVGLQKASFLLLQLRKSGAYSHTPWICLGTFKCSGRSQLNMFVGRVRGRNSGESRLQEGLVVRGCKRRWVDRWPQFRNTRCAREH